MKAPDKIYVPCSKDCSDCVDIRLWTREPLRGGHEYIRKDALLEWAEFFRDDYASKYHDGGCISGEDWGQMVAFQKVIDKINGL